MKKKIKINIFYRKRKQIKIIRPLLALNRFEVLKLCIFWELPIYIDLSNSSMNFRRNRIRHQLLPALRTFFNPKIDLALIKFIKIVNFENQYFDQQIKVVKNFFKIKYFNFQFLNTSSSPKWLVYLPHTLKQRLYYQLLKFHFKSLTFDEIQFFKKIELK